MPSVRHIPGNRRRSRTGCLTCRKRRRKCDERKPSCRNCSTRSVTCTYGDWTFVSDGPETYRADDDATRLEVDSNFHAVAAPPLVATSQLMNDMVNYQEAGGVNSSVSHIEKPSTPQFIASTTATVTAATQNPTDIDPNTAWTSENLAGDMTYAGIIPLGAIDDRSWQQRSMNRRSSLLRFRYQVVPWIESNNCKSMFGPAITSLARDSKIISDCISTCTRLRDDNLDLEHIMSDGLTVPSKLLERLAHEDTFTASVGYSLLAISSVFDTPPSEWATIASTREARLVMSALLSGEFELTMEPLKSLLRLQLKVDLAASIATNKAPSADLVIPLVEVLISDVDDPPSSYDSCLCCLALCLRLVHFELIPMLSGFHESFLQPVGRHASKWDRWFELWSRCMAWFQDRPPKMRPVLEGSDEDASDKQPFPIDVFTSATALQASLVMHISAAILLSQKPRLANATSTFLRLGSRSWHIQKVARMLLGNHFNEQWDPIVIAALLSVAKEMSHPSQQEALLSCFNEISSKTRIPMEKDIAELRTRWQSIQQDDPPNLSPAFGEELQS
ncbi:hypothetical protein M438DRAFT_64434 [Aureobasidium pullulans EXF-150]|uniref:Zn(2)-C6 fungal-type domain-containing protein n=1 Tax=Aureobasidium pullulans EXF-150 TaxID=1043002 RepID=A0A074X8M3_AURPU|nr:uncharacterized protein M438DRAFT_64434 [Aureobasidium pullulans EXF-150]KEQ81865.1 hypothetical protein M438DRAFT_64434 [Aureobasidium pullulans EXF-150]